MENKIYYSLNVANDKLERADLNTMATETLYSANPFLNSMAIDIVNSGSYITQSNLNGTGVTHFIANEADETFVNGISFEY